MKKKELKNKIAELEKELDEAHNTERVLRRIIALMKEQKCAYPQPGPVIPNEWYKFWYPQREGTAGTNKNSADYLVVNI